MNEHLKQILAYQCQVVGVDPETVDFTQNNWFMQHAWNDEQRDEFDKLVTAYFKKNRKAREALMSFPRVANIKKWLHQWHFQYGWKDVVRD